MNMTESTVRWVFLFTELAPAINWKQYTDCDLVRTEVQCKHDLLFQLENKQWDEAMSNYHGDNKCHHPHLNLWLIPR